MKNELRKYSIELRKTLNTAELSSNIIKNLTELSEYRRSKNIICYYPLKYEADTRECFKDKSKNWYLPKVNGSSLSICPYGSLKKGSFGIFEPDTLEENDLSIFDLIIIPACAADVKGYRLGWGKGFYDRFLPLLPEKCIKAVLVFSQLLYESVYPDERDFKCSVIITDSRILRV